MANETLADAIGWTTYEVAAGLASGHVPVRIGTAGDGGPVGVLTASVHGDEGPWGTIAINRMLGRAKASEFLGTLRVVPVAHPLATEADARQTELDLLDLNNSFPGDENGTHTQRLARLLAEKVLDGVGRRPRRSRWRELEHQLLHLPLSREPRTSGLDPDAVDL